ncbi:PepSY-associated TM helix domain-containing protein [Tunicatimonas pelagia]|uniref:PepSY-associated TM helix domain-containing protein n=1 Tax=Tunicatimonas pelagia TaxID=931531 RepID=UPI002665EA96|nr:PepSY-associated TM helix domain-containing protein [Tunicatimonas pelagia]WKN42993.1 PepSY-associated TM helix domain-containing protein [Tunicatimonas pelagia]
MKLKGLGNRAYNVLFHTHTVAGIVISFALFVIFYAGAFALFRHHIYQWENPSARIEVDRSVDYDQALLKVDSLYGLDHHTATSIVMPTEHYPFVRVFGAVHDTDSTTERIAASVVPGTYAVQDMNEPLTTLGDTIYHLHYFRQIPVVGIYLSGFVALFFLFASVTGLLIHWRNLFTKFYAFITEGKWKLIWTNAHTVLGVIGFPFQVMYAVTGAFFGLLTLILLPSVLLLYDGDSSQVFNKIRPEGNVVLDEQAPAADHLRLSTLMDQVQQAYPDFSVTRAMIRNYGQENALITWYVDDPESVASRGSLTMYMKDGVVLDDYSLLPGQTPYGPAVISVIGKLHFAEFGGLLMKIMYFVLALITGFMIISGVLIWQTARDNQRYTTQQRQFHHRVTKTYLAICLSMFPAFAILFLANKLVPMEVVGRVGWVNGIFFGSWLLLTLIGLRWDNYARLNRNYLFIGGLLSLGVPVVNGVATGDWFWQAWSTFPWVAAVDIFWLATGLVALYLVFRVLNVSTSITTKHSVRSSTAKPEPQNTHPQWAIDGANRSTH